MTRNTEPNELVEIMKGLSLLLGCHLLAGMSIFVLGFMIGPIVGIGGKSTIPLVWIIGAMGFLFWQLLYVIPLILLLQHRGKIGMMKGVIIGIALTALVSGACYLLVVAR